MLEIRSLTKAYDNHLALKGVSLNLKPAETLVIMGPSGCGKSTLLRCIPRLIAPDSGDIRFQGRSIMGLEGEALQAYRRRIGFVFQHQNLIRHMTARENAALGPHYAGVDFHEAMERAEEALSQVGLIHLADTLPDEMSGGERQRVAIARALAMKPEVILWDEPTVGLDPMLVDEVLSIMADLASTGETAMIVVTHEIPFALEVADRLALMEQGEVVLEGEPSRVLFEDTHPLSLRFRRLYQVRYAGLFGSGSIQHLGSGRNEGVPSRMVQGHMVP